MYAGVTDIITTDTRKIHQGLFYSTSKIFSAVANNTSKEILISVGNRELHLSFSCSLEGKAEIYFYEAPTVTSNGTALSIVNTCRMCPRMPTASAYHGPTTSADGTALYQGLFGVVLSTCNTRSTVPKWVLDKNTSYLFRLTNKSGASQDMGASFGFYEA